MESNLHSVQRLLEPLLSMISYQQIGMRGQTKRRFPTPVEERLSPDIEASVVVLDRTFEGPEYE